MRNIILGTVAAVAMLAAASMASAFKSGDMVTTRLYCNSEKAAKALSRAIGKNAFKGYKAVVQDKRSGCKDARLSAGAPSIQLILLKKMWTVKLPGPAAVTLQFWKAQDAASKIYYTFNVLQAKARK